MAVHPEQPRATPRRGPSGSPLDSVWNFLASPVSAAVLLALTALLATLAGIVPQMPPTLSDPLAQSQWLAETSSRWGAFGETLRSLGLFRLEDTVLWKTCLGLNLLAVLVVLEVAFRRAWRCMRNSLDNLSFPIIEERAAQSDAPGLLERLARHLSERGFRTRQSESGEIRQLHAVIRPWAWWLRATLHLGVLLILLALLVGGETLRTEQIALGPEESSLVGLREGWSVRLRELREDSGVPHGLSAALALFDAEANIVREANVGMQRPVRAGPLSLHLTATGPALEIRAEDAAGQPMPLQSAEGILESDALLLKFGETEPEQYFAIPEIGDTVRVVLHPDAVSETPQFLLQIYRGTETQPRLEELLGEARALTADGVTYTFTPTTFVTLTASAHSMRWLLWTGSLLALLSALLAKLFPAHAVLVQAAEVGGQVRLQTLATDRDSAETARQASAAYGRLP